MTGDSSRGKPVLGPDGKYRVQLSVEDAASFAEFRRKHFPVAKTQICRSCNKQLNKFNRAKYKERGTKRAKYPPYCKWCFAALVKSGRDRMLVEAADMTKLPRSLLELGEQAPPSGEMSEEKKRELDTRTHYPVPTVVLTSEQSENYARYLNQIHRNVRVMKRDPKTGKLVVLKEAGEDYVPVKDDEE